MQEVIIAEVGLPGEKLTSIASLSFGWEFRALVPGESLLQAFYVDVIGVMKMLFCG